MSDNQKELYEFEGIRLDPVRRVVSTAAGPLRLNSKAFETLLLLVRNRRRVMSKDELLQALWPDTFVEEVNLAQNISALRKVLGEAPGENRFIATIPGKGYQFVCNVRQIDQAPVEPAPSSSTEPASPDPAALAPQLALARASAGSRLRVFLWAGAGLAAAVAILAAAWIYRSRTAASPPMRSLAVLPFQPLAGSSDEDHLGLGMADAVITKLSGVRQLQVRPTDVAIRYADPQTDASKAARAMGVDSVLTGRIQRSGDRVRVTVQLVQAADGRTLWAQTFDDNAGSVFTVEDSISEKVVQALAVRLAAEDRLRLQRHYTENTEAYRDYLQGRYEEFTFTPDGMHKAIEHFNRAIASDPGYALAYAGLADAYTTSSDWLLAPREALPKAEAAARKAIAFDDNLAEAHGALAHVLLHEWRLPESDREFQIALALNPGYVSTYFAYGEYLASTGRFDDAIATLRKALTIDPLSPEINSFFSWDYYLKHDADNCLLSANNAIQMFPDYWLPHMGAGGCYYMKAQYDDAIRELTRALALNPLSTYSQANLAMSLAKAGRIADARKALAGLQAMRSQTYVSPVYEALVYHVLGDDEQEFRLLQKGYEDQAEWLLWLRFDPMFDGQRQDPRFQALVREVGV